jgi:menaquinol-cytochrome c reductase iron-sulfur subunit
MEGFGATMPDVRSVELLQTEPTRRNVFVGAIYAIWAAIAVALGLPAAIYLFFPPKISNRNDWVEIGTVEGLAPNSPVEMVFRQNRTDGWKIVSEKSTAWVVKSANNSITAFGPQCTHLGCAYHWDERGKEFVCPCHSSMFALDGRVLSGPAPRPLDRYDVRLEGDKILLGPLRHVTGAKA